VGLPAAEYCNSTLALQGESLIAILPLYSQWWAQALVVPSRKRSRGKLLKNQ